MSFYTLFRGRDAQFYWNLKAPNGRIILQSQGYTSKQNATNGIDSAKKHAPYDQYYNRLVSTNSQPYFNLKASNGQVIGVSEMYSSVQARENGIESCKTYSPIAEIKDETTANVY